MRLKRHVPLATTQHVPVHTLLRPTPSPTKRQDCPTEWSNDCSKKWPGGALRGQGGPSACRPRPGRHQAPRQSADGPTISAPRAAGAARALPGRRCQPGTMPYGHCQPGAASQALCHPGTASRALLARHYAIRALPAGHCSPAHRHTPRTTLTPTDTLVMLEEQHTRLLTAAELRTKRHQVPHRTAMCRATPWREAR
jgi:hypothetical protein